MFYCDVGVGGRGVMSKGLLVLYSGMYDEGSEGRRPRRVSAGSIGGTVFVTICYKQVRNR